MVDQIKMLKEIQVICKSLLVASRGYNQESPTMEGGKQWTPEDNMIEDTKIQSETRNKMHKALPQLLATIGRTL
jgi:hypothetical protein